MEIKKREVAYDGFFKMYKLTVEQEGQTFTREQYDRGTAVAALVFDTEKQEYVLTRQFRIGSESELVEIVAGMVDDGEEPEASMKREIEEEIGYEVDKLEFLHRFYSSPGGSTEDVLLYYAEVSHQKTSGGGNGSENEHIEILCFSPEELDALQTPDAKTIIAQQWVRLNKRK
ncbi:NUDIX domain-containing protein [Pontibacter akesuensis]|uniref:GDP-mannose pyrophosphatase n=1 Tax=Pontibacter akesuensis TaxID=388950 RepID=A0A1I7KHL1_9BACT|nr:NUDIX hydrolase [Pontibacter akesuensis]GHA78976.1 ADP-ribose pyrophosphatase [Pontibacter akesuensis]SFU96911.1 ADP-ribose pyrophosphatase [Pontibacter akesuensis]